MSASLIFLTGVFFIQTGSYYKYITIISSIFTLLILVSFDRKFAGFPAEPGEGKYPIQGWEINESNREIYLLLAPVNEDPINVVMPFSLNNALIRQEAKKNIGTYKDMSIKIKKNIEKDNLEYTLLFEKRFTQDIFNEDINEDTFNDDINNINSQNRKKEDVTSYPKPN